MLEIDLLGVN